MTKEPCTFEKDGRTYTFIPEENDLQEVYGCDLGELDHIVLIASKRNQPLSYCISIIKDGVGWIVHRASDDKPLQSAHPFPLMDTAIQCYLKGTRTL